MLYLTNKRRIKMDINITEKIKYVGVNDKTLDLFESQYIKPIWNLKSYLINIEKYNQL